MPTSHHTPQLTEAQMVHLARNALLVAGHEMGKKGDHWPVIKSTIHSIMKDWEELQIERNVHEELKRHYVDILKEMEKAVALCPFELRHDMEKSVQELYELYEASFAEIDESKFTVEDEDLPRT